VFDLTGRCARLAAISELARAAVPRAGALKKVAG
jgi:hypothetical protein